MTPRKQPVAGSLCALLLTGAYLLRITKLLFFCFCLFILFIHVFFESICADAFLAKPCFASIAYDLSEISINLFFFLVFYIWFVWYACHLSAKIKSAIAKTKIKLISCGIFFIESSLRITYHAYPYKSTQLLSDSSRHSLSSNLAFPQEPLSHLY